MSKILEGILDTVTNQNDGDINPTTFCSGKILPLNGGQHLQA